jgi:hypothetical protein
MTWWGPLQVLTYAQRAGWGGRDAKVATAVALVTSEGADHFHWTHDTTPDVDQRGLWGLDVARIGDEDAHQLYDPMMNAALAYRLWCHYGASWEWHQSYQSTRGTAVRAMLGYLDQGKNWRVGPTTIHPLALSINRPWTMAEASRAITIVPAQPAPIQGEMTWPQTTS